MSQTVDAIVSEEQAAIQAEVNQRVIVRLESAKSAAEERVSAAQADLDELAAEIEARTPAAEEEVQG